MRVARSLLGLAAAGAFASIGCGSSPPAASPSSNNATQVVFDVVVPSVVAVLNDDRAEKEEEAKLAMKEMGGEAHAPKKTIDVSLRKEPTPDGTGFLIEGGLVVTAAHVVHSPQHLKLTTRAQQTVDAELVHIDEVRDVALLKPKGELRGVPPLHLADANPSPGRRVWALGHTGTGFWSLSWGVSEGITSGVVDFRGANLLLFDAAIYPGFSGGPVIALDGAGKPVVVGVNHAILFTPSATATISSASSASDIKQAVARKPVPIEAKLAEFARTKNSETRAELFITERLSVHKDPRMTTTAAILGNEREVEPGVDDIVRIPAVAMIFGLPKGKHDLTFVLEDPDDKVVATIQKSVRVAERERVSFSSADFRFDPTVAGRYDVLAKEGDKVLGRTDVWVEDPDDDDQPIDDEDRDDVEGGEPRVDVVVASYGRDDPFALTGIRSSWMEYRYPRRVPFSWFARGSRGWSGLNVAVSAFVLDEGGHIVGSGMGCLRPELRPESSWSCAGSGGTPLLAKEGRYDVVFAMNDRPIAVWPMEAMVRTNAGESVMERWLKELRRQHRLGKHSRPKATPAPAPKATPKP